MMNRFQLVGLQAELAEIIAVLEPQAVAGTIEPGERVLLEFVAGAYRQAKELERALGGG